MTGATSPLEIEIRRRITAAGPMPVVKYMALCLTDSEHGYYRTRDPLGVAGDFTTAPEISQMFGEMIGLWMVAIWRAMGTPENMRLIELGPGRGTMMSDALRAAKVVPEFGHAAAVHLVEISPVLRQLQERTLEESGVPVSWYDSMTEVPVGPAIIVANEFFDALPVHQAVKMPDGWHERGVGIGDDGKFIFVALPDPIAHFAPILPAAMADAREGEIFEWRTAAEAFEIGRRIGREPGAALIIDYGHDESAAGETFQAVGQHGFADPLSTPGMVDLTAHVDFQAISRAVEAMGVRGYGPVTQAEFLHRLGIKTRAAALKQNLSRAKAADIDAALARLTGGGRTGMGSMFKASAFAHPKLGMPPGFENSWPL